MVERPPQAQAKAPDEPLDTADAEEPGARAPVMAPRVYVPTEEERRKHCVCHLPYASWCGDCVSGRGKDDPHKQIQVWSGPPLVEVDYSFLKTGLPDDVIKAILLALLRPEAYSFASVVTAKGREDQVVIAALLRWLQEAGIGGTTFAYGAIARHLYVHSYRKWPTGECRRRR